MRGIAALVCIALSTASANSAPDSLDRSGGTPDFCQTDRDANLPGDGERFCGPTSASDSLMYLAAHDYPALRPAASDEKRAQIAIIQKLGSANYMDTSDNNGTRPEALAEGLEKFVEQAGYKASLRIERLGEGGPPSPRWLEDALGQAPATAVFINVGWYTHDSSTYTRSGGHWVVMVGYGKDRSGNPDPNMILIHDPAPRAGQDKRTQYVKLVPLQGTLQRRRVDGRMVRTDAAGYWQVSGDMFLHPHSDAAIIDAAVSLELDKP
jgi:hypothetical protein